MASPSFSEARPANSSVRYRVLAITVLLAFITYLDRVCISITAPTIMRELALTPVQMGFVFSAFTFAYGLFEIPTGWWADRVGTRRVLTRIVVWWSAFTMATAGAFSYGSLLAIRFLFGVGEAGAWPSVARTFARWFPLRERGTAQGIFFMGAHLGAGVTPLLVSWLMGYLPWRGVFLLFGLLGFAWAIGWYTWFRDEPRDHPAVSAAECEYIGAAPAGSGHSGHFWGQLLRSQTVIGLCLMYFTQTYAFYFYTTWFPTYLSKKGMPPGKLGLLAGLPMLLSVLADLTGGLSTDYLTRRYGLRVGRCSVGFASLFFAGVFVLLSTLTQDPVIAAVLIAIAGAWGNFLLGAAWGACVDIARTHAAVVSAAMNTAGQVGGVLSPIVFAQLTKGGVYWDAPIYVIGGLYLFGASCWLWIRPDRPLILEQPHAHGSPAAR